MMEFVMGLKEAKPLCRRKMENDNVKVTALSILWTSKIDFILETVSTMPGDTTF